MWLYFQWVKLLCQMIKPQGSLLFLQKEGMLHADNHTLSAVSFPKIAARKSLKSGRVLKFRRQVSQSFVLYFSSLNKLYTRSLWLEGVWVLKVVAFSYLQFSRRQMQCETTVFVANPELNLCSCSFAFFLYKSSILQIWLSYPWKGRSTWVEHNLVLTKPKCLSEGSHNVKRGLLRRFYIVKAHKSYQIWENTEVLFYLQNSEFYVCNHGNLANSSFHLC